MDLSNKSILFSVLYTHYCTWLNINTQKFADFLQYPGPCREGAEKELYVFKIVPCFIILKSINLQVIVKEASQDVETMRGWVEMQCMDFLVSPLQFPSFPVMFVLIKVKDLKKMEMVSLLRPKPRDRKCFLPFCFCVS